MKRNLNSFQCVYSGCTSAQMEGLRLLDRIPNFFASGDRAEAPAVGGAHVLSLPAGVVRCRCRSSLDRGCGLRPAMAVGARSLHRTAYSDPGRSPVPIV